MTTILPGVKIDPSPNDIITDDTPIEMLKPDYDETVMDDTQIINGLIANVNEDVKVLVPVTNMALSIALLTGALYQKDMGTLV
ncbi:hypothetical protein OROMI_018543 [Orobanche minor]